MKKKKRIWNHYSINVVDGKIMLFFNGELVKNGEFSMWMASDKIDIKTITGRIKQNKK